MTGLALTLVRAGGAGRLALVAGCTAVVSGLLLVVVALLRLPRQPDELFFNLVADPGVRGGTAFATVLLAVPALLLLYQAVRLGTAARERRLASLRVAGATPGEVRFLGAVEVGLPALAGSLLGIGVFAVLRLGLGGVGPDEQLRGGRASSLSLVPTTVAPTWWQALLVVLGVSAAGVAVGLMASRPVIVSPLGMTRRQAPPAPRPWGLLFWLAALAVAAASIGGSTPGADIELPWLEPTMPGEFVVLGLVLLGILSLSPWVAYRVGRFTVARAAAAPLLLASARLVSEPRPVGRAAAAIGGISLCSGVLGVIAVPFAELRTTDAFYLVSLLLVAVGLVASLGVVTATLAVHSVESLWDRKRSVAALVAMGVTLNELEASRRWEVALAAVPAAVVGCTVPGLLSLSALAFTPQAALVYLITVLATVGLVLMATVLAVWATQGFMVRASSPAHLRTQ